jgi:hypothetical protein
MQTITRPAAKRFAKASVVDVVRKLEDLGLHVQARGSGFLAQCPAHADHTPSLSIDEGSDGAALIFCHTGCRFIDVLDALGLRGAGTAKPISDAELLARVRRDEAEQEAKVTHVREIIAAGQSHPDRIAAIKYVSETLLWDSLLMIRLGVGWDGSRVVIPIVDDDGIVVGVDRYCAPGTKARINVGDRPKMLGFGKRGLWPAPAIAAGIRGDSAVCLVEGPPAAATLLGCGLRAISFPSATGLRGDEGKRIAASFDRAIVLVDADAAGRKAGPVCCALLRAAGVDVDVVDLLPGVDDGTDAADVLRARATRDHLKRRAVGAWLSATIGEMV